MRLRIIAPNGEKSERVATASAIRLGRDPACEVPFDAALYPQVSAQHARIDQTASGWVLTALSRSNKTLLNDQPVEGPAALKIGDRLRLGYSGPTVEILADQASGARAVPVVKPNRPAEPSTGQAEATADFGATAQAAPQHLALLRGSLGAMSMLVGQGGVIGRATGQVEFALEHPHVSRRHAELFPEGGRFSLRDLGSANGTYVNGQRIAGPVRLNPGDKIDIGPFSLLFDGNALVSRSRSNNIELTAHQLKRVVKDRATGKPLTLLDDIDLVIRPRESGT